jgi:hypothetical protein
MSGTWTEAMLRDLGADEHDFREFKASALVADGRMVQPSFLTSLSKQISAFANGGGGHVFLGIDDQGRVDGGVPVDLKPGGTRSWLEDVVGGLVEPPLPAFNVFEILGGAPDSSIPPGRAVYAVEVPTSELAPHQALDYRYYLRIAGKSRPMGNLHLQDVLRRTRHPRVVVTRLGPYGPVERTESDPRGPKAVVGLHVLVTNEGATLAHHVGGELTIPRALTNRDVRQRMLTAEPGLQVTQRPGEIRLFRYHPNPIFPGQELGFQRAFVVIHSANAASIDEGACVTWRIYADDAPPRSGAVPLKRFTEVRQAVAWIRGHDLSAGKL